MEKVKLAICISDEEYQKRFVRCLMNHYKNDYEIHVFSHLEELQDINKKNFALVVVDQYEDDILEKMRRGGCRLLCLQENGECTPKKEEVDDLTCTNKYQEVYKIVDMIEILTKGDIQIRDGTSFLGQACKVIGVFSLTAAHLQLPFMVTLASICGERKSVLLLDMQTHSGFANTLVAEEYCDNEEERSGMEDFITIATTGVYTKGRILAGIGHKPKWDYIYPVKNTECLLEASEPIYETLFDILSKEQGYEIIIVNMGASFVGMYEVMEKCDKFYLLEEAGVKASWREKDFVEEMTRRGKDAFLHRITRIEIPAVFGTDISWQRLAEQWEWNSLGDTLRQQLWTEKRIG